MVKSFLSASVAANAPASREGARELTSEELAFVAGGGWLEIVAGIGESVAGSAVWAARHYAASAVRTVEHGVEAGWNKVRQLF